MTSLPLSRVQMAVTSLPSGVVSSNSTPICKKSQLLTMKYANLQVTLNFNSMDFRVVEVLMDQTPPDSEISKLGLETVAAFLRR